MLPLKTKENFKQICQCKHFPASESKRQRRRRRLIQASSIFTHTSSYNRNRFHCYLNTFHILYSYKIYNVYFVHIIQTHTLHFWTSLCTMLKFLLHVSFSLSHFVCVCFFNSRTIFSRWLLFVLAFPSEHYRRIPFENGWHLFETKWKWFLLFAWYESYLV